MRPFRFFFLLAVGFILLVAVARVVFFAFIFAAIMSLIFFGVKTIVNFFSNLNWEQDKGYYGRRQYKEEEFEYDPRYDFLELENMKAPWEKERIIQIR